MPGEFTRIRQFLRAFDVPASPAGPGDDCAVLEVARGQQLCVTVDSIVEGVHFDRAHFSPADIGHKALAVNVSDLASMGARPTWAVCALALPPDFDDRALRGLSRGMAALARRCGLSLVGGNFTRARELSVTVTVAGEVPRGKALRRDTARAGDLLYVTGDLGDAAAGLALLRAGPERVRALDRRSLAALLGRQKRPVPQWELGLLVRPHARAAIDVSDGLSADVGHLAQASGLRAVIEEARLPLSPALQRAVERGVLPGPASRWALAGGEDYVLVLAVAPARARALERAMSRAGQPLTAIGCLESGRGVRVRGSDGRLRRPPRGWDHFAGGQG